MGNLSGSRTAFFILSGYKVRVMYPIFAVKSGLEGWRQGCSSAVKEFTVGSEEADLRGGVTRDSLCPTRRGDRPAHVLSDDNV